MDDEDLPPLQRAIRARGDLFAREPLLANGGRIMNILNPETYGWDRVHHWVETDGFVALMFVDRDLCLARLAEIYGDDRSFPAWESFGAPAETAVPVCDSLVAGTILPEGWTVECETNPDEATIAEIRALNEATGISPLPAYYLRGEEVPGAVAWVRTSSGAMAACATGSLRFHPDGPLGGCFFAGAASVETAFRSRGLGALVFAALLSGSHDLLNWSGVIASAVAGNAASAGMVRRCGLKPLPGKASIVIDFEGGYLTR